MPTAHVRDIDVYYEVAGSGPPLLLIHGLGSSVEDWEPQIDEFAKQYRVVAYDVRGHGRTSKPRGSYSLQQFANDAAGLILALDTGPMHVVGLSMGGMIAFQLVVDHPELVRSLVIVNSGPELVLRTWQQKLAIYQRFAIVRLFGMRKMGEMLSSRLLPEPKWAARRRLFIERWARNDKSAYLRATRALIGWSVSKHLPSIQQPTLVVTADRDYTPVAFKEAYAAQMPNARLAVIANARHMLPIELPGDFNQTVLSFLAGLGAERVPSLPAIKSVERV